MAKRFIGYRSPWKVAVEAAHDRAEATGKRYQVKRVTRVLFALFETDEPVREKSYLSDEAFH